MKKIVFAALIVSAMSPLPSAWADQRFAAFPVDVKMTVAAKVGKTIYAGLGTAGSGWYALDMSRRPAQWEALAPFPDQPRENANAVAIGPVIYVFNGQGKARPENRNLIVFDTVWKYDTVANAWSKVSTRSPLGGLAAGATTLDRQNILFFGGANKAIFDGYWTDHVDAAAAGKTMQSEVDERYFKQRPQDYLFTAQVLSYNPSRNQWRNLGIDPYPATTGAAIAVNGNNITLIGGEIKPGLRSPNAKSVTVIGEKLSWHKLSPMVPAPGEAAQEGVAGAFAGYSKGVLLAAGGANFPGAWKQFKNGQLFAHKGLSKTWHADIYANIDGEWKVAGKLPAALGYGSYIQLEDGVLVVGGERQGGAGSKDVFLMKWNGKSVDIVR